MLSTTKFPYCVFTLLMLQLQTDEISGECQEGMVVYGHSDSIKTLRCHEDSMRLCFIYGIAIELDRCEDKNMSQCTLTMRRPKGAKISFLWEAKDCEPEPTEGCIPPNSCKMVFKVSRSSRAGLLDRLGFGRARPTAERQPIKRSRTGKVANTKTIAGK